MALATRAVRYPTLTARGYVEHQSGCCRNATPTGNEGASAACHGIALVRLHQYGLECASEGVGSDRLNLEDVGSFVLP